MSEEHKHASILRAIADGKPIQVLIVWDENSDVWVDVPVRDSISLYGEKTYRIKPEEIK